MNGRTVKQGDPWEQDIFKSKFYRKTYAHPDEIRFVKRRANKRERRRAKEEISRGRFDEALDQY
jgi:hypothetical protein